jgi:hypothetical protein
LLLYGLVFTNTNKEEEITMTKRIEVQAPLSRREKITVTLGTAALGAVVLGAPAVAVANKLSQPDTHEKTVQVEFGKNTPTIYDGAIQLRRQGATEDVSQLERELKAAEPGADGVVHEGDTATVHIDVVDK